MFIKANPNPLPDLDPKLISKLDLDLEKNIRIHNIEIGDFILGFKVKMVRVPMSEDLLLSPKRNSLASVQLGKLFYHPPPGPWRNIVMYVSECIYILSHRLYIYRLCLLTG